MRLWFLSIFLIVCSVVITIKLVRCCVLTISSLNQFEHSPSNELLAFLRAACDLLEEKCNRQKHWTENKNDGGTVLWDYYCSDLQSFKEQCNLKA